MKKKKDKLEQFLSGETSGLSPEQRKIMESTEFLIKSLGHEKLPADEKKQLWNRISDSAESPVPAKTFPAISGLWLRAAATVVIFLAIGLGYFALRETPEHAMARAASQAIPSAGDTRLILADKKAIYLTKKNSSVIYRQEGNSIQIDSGTVVNRQTFNAQEEYNTLIVPYGKRASLKLSDGTEIWLNSGSKLVYPARFSDKTREVYLEGQAYFSVAHQHHVPFYVHTKDVKIAVLGTEFDVSAYRDDARTYAVLAKGSIELTTDQKTFFRSEKTKMKPGTRADYDPVHENLQVRAVDVAEYTTWKDGYLILRNVPLHDILKRLARYYNVSLLLRDDKLASETFSGKLDLQEDISQVMDIIAATTSLNYHQTERRFILEKNTDKK